jgi:hypothetical protein
VFGAIVTLESSHQDVFVSATSACHCRGLSTRALLRYLQQVGVCWCAGRHLEWLLYSSWLAGLGQGAHCLPHVFMRHAHPFPPPPGMCLRCGPQTVSVLLRHLAFQQVAVYQIGAAAAAAMPSPSAAYLALAGREERRVIVLRVSPDNVHRVQSKWKEWFSFNPKLTGIVDLMNRLGGEPLPSGPQAQGLLTPHMHTRPHLRTLSPSGLF